MVIVDLEKQVLKFSHHSPMHQLVYQLSEIPPGIAPSKANMELQYEPFASPAKAPPAFFRNLVVLLSIYTPLAAFLYYLYFLRLRSRLIKIGNMCSACCWNSWPNCVKAPAITIMRIILLLQQRLRESGHCQNG